MDIIATSNTLYENTSLTRKAGFAHIQSKEDLTLHNLRELNPEYIFFVHWSYIIPAEIYEIYPCVIFHMTDLPFGRGGSPLQNLLERGIYHTKISAIRCIGGLDAGDVYLKRDFDISEGTASELYARAGEIISGMIDEIRATHPTPVPQEGDIVTFKRRTPEQSNIAPLLDIRKVYDYIRMLDADGYPKAYMETEGLRLEFSNPRLMDDGRLNAQVIISPKK